MKPKDYINKKAQEEALKAFGATQLNNNQESSAYFVGKINASRTKITDPVTKKEYDLIFTGNPREFELAQRLSDNKAVVNAQNNKTINVDGRNLAPVFLLLSGAQRFVYLPKNAEGSRLALINFDLVTLPTQEEVFPDNASTFPGSGNIFTTAQLSVDGRHLVVFKFRLYVRRHFTLIPVPLYVDGIPGETVFCSQSPLCTISEGGVPPSQGIQIVDSPIQSSDFKCLCSYWIYKNFRIEQGELVSSSIIKVSNYEPFGLDDFPTPSIVSIQPDPPGSITITGGGSQGFKDLLNLNFNGLYFDFKSDSSYELICTGGYRVLNSGSFGTGSITVTTGVNACRNFPGGGTLCGTSDPIPTQSFFDFSGFYRTSAATESAGPVVAPIHSSYIPKVKCLEIVNACSDSTPPAEKIGANSFISYAQSPPNNPEFGQEMRQLTFSSRMYNLYFNEEQFLVLYKFAYVDDINTVFLSTHSQESGTALVSPSNELELSPEFSSGFSNTVNLEEYYLGKEDFSWSVEEVISELDLPEVGLIRFETPNKLCTWVISGITDTGLTSKVYSVRLSNENKLIRGSEFKGFEIPSGYSVSGFGVK